MTDWQQAYECLIQRHYEQAAQLYEQAIEQFPDERSAYWYLGLVWLLQGQEAEAQAVWLMAVADGEPEQVDQWAIDLAALLQQEAERLETSDRSSAWLVRQHLWSILPTDLNNLLHLLNLALQIEHFDPEDATIAQAIELLQTEAEANPETLFQVLQRLLSWDVEHPITLEFATACLPYASTSWIESLLSSAIRLAMTLANTALACRFGELCLQLDSQHLPTLVNLSRFYQAECRYTESIALAQQYFVRCESVTQKIVGNMLRLRGFMSIGSAWQDAQDAYQQQIALLHTWLATAEQPTQMPDPTVCSALFFAPYLSDRPQETRVLQHQISSRYQSLLQSHVEQIDPSYQPYPLAQCHSSHNVLRIGYLSRCMRKHSVGWLCRWVFEHFDRDRFAVYAYFHQHPQLEPFTQQWFADKATHWRCVVGDARSVAQQIRADEIDILVDLDSLTAPATCSVMALKPAPIQITWLGLDATGLPAIDYFLADPYVLPDHAPDYYSERIWRLPQTYVAVDGFEVGVPTLRREQLNIPAEAIVYFSSQYAYKRHPETVRSQMQILKQVPNSYLVIKGLGDEQGIQAFFEQMAAAAGVDPDQLRFLPLAPDEQTHRANLSIADIVLDTFPYNGATTTLETLWMGIPLVTQVGTQFASRNSYTMLKNVGVTEGIAWSHTEYVEWGVRLGRDMTLRQQISWKLQRSRLTSPLWNARQFVRDLETAYEQMWNERMRDETFGERAS